MFRVSCLFALAFLIGCNPKDAKACDAPAFAPAYSQGCAVAVPQQAYVPQQVFAPQPVYAAPVAQAQYFAAPAAPVFRSYAPAFLAAPRAVYAAPQVLAAPVVVKQRVRVLRRPFRAQRAVVGVGAAVVY